jgi:hypothetical protein
MSERLNAYLDGELSLDDLDARERAQAAAFEARVTDLRAELDALSGEDLDRAVMRRIAELGLEPLPARRGVAIRRGLASLLTVREVRIRWRPIYGLAAAAAIAAVVLVPTLGPRGDPSLADGAVQPASTLYVQFRLMAGDASNVALAGSFSGWQPNISMRPSQDGIWTVMLPLAPGVYDYAFIVDGQQWVADPYAPRVDDGFGGTHSRLMLLAPQS